MADNIFEELKKYQIPKRLPRIATVATNVYEAAGFKLDDAGLATLRAELAKDAGDLKSLTDAIVGLGAFAIYVRDSREDNETAEKIARLIGEHAPKYFPIGERIVNALQDMALKASDLFDQFSGRLGEDKRRAPKHDEPGAPGSLPLKRLIPPGEMTPVPQMKPKKKR